MAVQTTGPIAIKFTEIKTKTSVVHFKLKKFLKKLNFNFINLKLRSIERPKRPVEGFACQHENSAMALPDMKMNC